MNFEFCLGLMAGLLQISVAAYALWLGRRLGSRARIGWLLYFSLSGMAIVHWMLSEQLLRSRYSSVTQVNLLYTLTSVLLLVVLHRLRGLMGRYSQAERESAL